MEDWTQTLTAGPLLGIAAAAIALLLILIIRFHLHAFPTLVLVSLLTAFATGIPAGAVVDTMTDSFAGTLGSVALLVGFGAAQKMAADRLSSITGGLKIPGLM